MSKFPFFNLDNIWELFYILYNLFYFIRSHIPISPTYPEFIFGIIVTATTIWFGLLPAVGAGIAGLNIAPEIPAMTMFRHIVFGAVIGIILRSKAN